jgi:hypothetical protein
MTPTDTELLEQMGKLPKGATRELEPDPPPLPEAEPLLKCINDAVQAWILGVEGAAVADVYIKIKPPMPTNDVDQAWAIEVEGVGLGSLEGVEPKVVYQRSWSGIGDDLRPALNAVREDFRQYIARRRSELDRQMSAYEQSHTMLDMGLGLDNIWDSPEDRPLDEEPTEGTLANDAELLGAMNQMLATESDQD